MSYNGLGYHAVDLPEGFPLFNILYKSEGRLFHHFFCLLVKLLAKERIASKRLKGYDHPKTPYQRIMEFEPISETVKIQLQNELQSLNPFKLGKEMEIKMENASRIFLE